MAEFIIDHTHEPTECQAAFDSLKDAHESLRGTEFFCTCPGERHGGFFLVEAPDAEAAMALLPETMRSTSTVYAGETMSVP